MGWIFLLAAIVAFLWQQKKPVLLPGEKTTRLNPIVWLLLLGAAILCFGWGSSSHSSAPPKEEAPPAAQKDRIQWTETK